MAQNGPKLTWLVIVTIVMISACLFAFTYFSSESEMMVRKHTNTKHQESPDNTDHWKCSICYDKLITVKEYNEHIKYHLEEIEELDIEFL